MKTQQKTDKGHLKFQVSFFYKKSERGNFMFHKFIDTILDIIFENQVNLACIRVTESTAQKISTERINIEAIIQELIASSSIEKYYVGQISTISAKLGIARENFKPLIDSKANDCEFFNDWNKYNKEEKESLLAALSAFNI